MAATSTAIPLICVAHLILMALGGVTGSLCESKGECGLNGICKLDGDTSTCVCYSPGFHPIDAQNSSRGCLPDASPQPNKCRLNAEMRPIGHFDWSGNDYENMEYINETACKEACLRDCFCTVAIFDYLDNVGNCWKKALPLIDGRASATRNGFVKVYVEEHNSVTKQREERRGKVVAGVGISLATFCVAIGALFSVIWMHVWRPKLRFLREAYNSEGLKAFSYREIEGATQGFKQVVGRGAFGKVYKGVLPDGRPVAVKMLENEMKQGEEAEIGEKEFRTEMIAIGSSHHKNLVQLYGFCNQGLHRILVYEYMPNGSLDRALFYGEVHLDWEVRLEIALGTARGLLYLHEECRYHILHCDVKPQNILLDESYKAKLSDFGIAKLVGAGQTWTFTAARGTIGYMAPEWQRGAAITVKVDVYSFGVMLLEIVCCRKMSKEDVPENENILSDWAYDCLRDGGLFKLVEQQQTGGINPRQLERMVLVGLWCVQDDPSLRPSMKRVVQLLEGTLEIPVPPRPGFSSQAPLPSNFGF